jgi:hypothetical protein
LKWWDPTAVPFVLAHWRFAPEFPAFVPNRKPTSQIRAQCRNESACEAWIKKKKPMNRKHLSLAIAALLAAGGLWFAGSAWRTHASHTSRMGIGFKTPRGSNSDSDKAASLPRASRMESAPGTNNRPTQSRMLRPPNPSQIFRDFTPEQRVEFARKGHGPGG